jgi:hypothetical protein
MSSRLALLRVPASDTGADQGPSARRGGRARVSNGGIITPIPTKTKVRAVAAEPVPVIEPAVRRHRGPHVVHPPGVHPLGAPPRLPGGGPLDADLFQAPSRPPRRPRAPQNEDVEWILAAAGDQPRGASIAEYERLPFRPLFRERGSRRSNLGVITFDLPHTQRHPSL